MYLLILLIAILICGKLTSAQQNWSYCSDVADSAWMLTDIEVKPQTALTHEPIGFLQANFLME